MNNVGSLSIHMPLTEEVIKTQVYYKVDDRNTLEYTGRSCKTEEYSETPTDYYKMFFDFGIITSEENIYHTYVGFTMMIYKRSPLVLTLVLLI